MRLYVIYDFSHRCDLLCILIGDLQIEFVFKLHYELDYVERVSAQVILEVRFTGNFRLFYTQAFDHDALNAIIYIGHPVHLP